MPLTAAMTHQLQDPDGRTLKVSESVVLLEIENDRAQVATLERYAKRQEGDPRTIRVWDARRVSAPTPDDTYRDMLARVKGSGVGEMAIGQWLEEFIGWDLPIIVMPDGTERRLYPELIMPLMFVEQRGGWRGVQAAMPTYGIPDIRKRAREYILGLTVYERQRRRLELRREADELKRGWTTMVRAAARRLGDVGIRLHAPDEIDPDFGENTPIRTVDLRSSRPLTRGVGGRPRGAGAAVAASRHRAQRRPRFPPTKLACASWSPTCRRPCSTPANASATSSGCAASKQTSPSS